MFKLLQAGIYEHYYLVTYYAIKTVATNVS